MDSVGMNNIGNNKSEIVKKCSVSPEDGQTPSPSTSFNSLLAPLNPNSVHKLDSLTNRVSPAANNQVKILLFLIKKKLSGRSCVAAAEKI